VVAAVIWAGAVFAYRRWQLRHNFAHLEGVYRISRKGAGEREQEAAWIAVRGNVLHVSLKDLDDGGMGNGEIEMNPNLPRSVGHCWQDKPGHKQLWGFWSVQSHGVGTLLVHTTYAKPGTNDVAVSGYVWEQITG
jgi:hypothetical protein